MPIRPRVLVVALLFSVADRAVAQRARVPADTGFVPWTSLTGRPDFMSAARDAVIQYPAMMRDANVEGTVRLRMIVGVDGAPEPKTVRVVASTHDLFTRSVEDSLLQWSIAKRVELTTQSSGSLHANTDARGSARQLRVTSTSLQRRTGPQSESRSALTDHVAATNRLSSARRRCCRSPPQESRRGRADQSALHLVAARRRADDRAGSRADRGVTTRVLHRRCRRWRRIVATA